MVLVKKKTNKSLDDVKISPKECEFFFSESIIFMNPTRLARYCVQYLVSETSKVYITNTGVHPPLRNSGLYRTIPTRYHSS